jgi:hypothetical protein
MNLSTLINKYQFLACAAERNGDHGLAFDLRCKISAIVAARKPGVARLAADLDHSAEDGDIQY